MPRAARDHNESCKRKDIHCETRNFNDLKMEIRCLMQYGKFKGFKRRNKEKNFKT